MLDAAQLGSRQSASAPEVSRSSTNSLAGGALSGGDARKSRQFSDAVAFPDAQQQHFCAGRIPKDVENIARPGNLKEARATRVGLRRGAGHQQSAEFSNLFRRVAVQVFDERRSFCNGDHASDSIPTNSLAFLS